jgi:hypothetical protein
MWCKDVDGFMIRSTEVCHEHNNEILGSTKGGGFLH